ncbi:MAG TPA: PilC/PilY family type IV pilus protein [Myxococcota bacterium]|nr:PilC/PilY family type IV pilus protein [Myxococcota bacterium]
MIEHHTSHRSLRTIGLTLALCALAAVVGPANVRGADDTAIFSTSVPPNVLLMIDNSGSMNEIMWHPNFSPGPPASTCSIFGWFAPGTGGSYPTNGSANLNDQNSKATPYVCDSTSHDCRFQITESTTGFVQTGSLTCPASSQCGRGGTASASCKAGYITRQFCGKSRRMYVDPDTACKNNQTWYGEEYSEWYFSPAADPYFGGLAEPNTNTSPLLIDAEQNGTHYIDGSKFGLFQRSRITAAKEIARDVIFQINTNCPPGVGNLATLDCPAAYGGNKDAVRFGVSQFDANAHGGFVRAAIDKYSTNRLQLDAAIDALDAQTSTPLAEWLFKSYTYFMSRTTADIPLGKDNFTRFPAYQYSLTNGGNTASPPPSPLDCDDATAGAQPCTCQKNFVIILTDGEPTNDNFACESTCSGDRTVGFNNFASKLIGDYAPQPSGGDEVEVGYAASGNGSKYLDDIALYMHTKDFRPDLSGSQVMDVYTVGFATGGAGFANSLLQRTAQNGNGLFFTGTQAQEITDALVTSINDIIQKSQSFTAATVPASRTADGGNFYITEFVPSNTDPFWKGHLMNFQVTADGQILDAGGNCAVNDPSGSCTSGTIKSNAVPFWDAASQIPSPSGRTLFTTLNGATAPFDITPSPGIQAADLGVTWPTVAYPGDQAATLGGATNASKAEYLTDEIVEYVRGCVLGTGVSNACVTRPTLLGDIFHSNPVVVGRPASYINEATYKAFAANWATRDRVIYAGANDGFLHAFHAGDWNGSATPPAYDRGTGIELFGFMPWTARQNIKQLPIDTNGRDYYFVDGSPRVADVWFYPTPTTATKSSPSEWHTVLVGGMRQGGASYYALDVTDPSSFGPSMYLWEFPRESDPTTIKQYVGQTWSEPVITKVRVDVGGNNNGGQGFERWVAIVGGGYDPKGDPNSLSTYDGTTTSTTSTSGRAIFMIDMKTGQILAEKKFIWNAAASDPQSQMKYAIPSMPAVFDLDFDGFADVVYVGDLGGNMWKWTIHDVGVDSDSDGKIDTWPFRKFFDAPEFPAVGVATHFKSFFYPPNATFKNNTLWLGFGSGERADLRWAGIPDSPNDPTELENNRFYAMTDIDPLEQSVPAQTTLTESNLLDVSGSETCASITPPLRGYFFKVGRTDANGDGVDDEGEKFVTATALFSGYVFASTFTPTQTGGDPCISGGTAQLYVFRIDCSEGFFTQPSGSGPKRTLSLGTGMPTDPRISISAGDSGGGGGGGGPCPCGGANKVFVITSDNKVQNECTPCPSGGGTRTQYWRPRQ